MTHHHLRVTALSRDQADAGLHLNHQIGNLRPAVLHREQTLSDAANLSPVMRKHVPVSRVDRARRPITNISHTMRVQEVMRQITGVSNFLAAVPKPGQLVKEIIELRLHTKHSQAGYSKELLSGTKAQLNLRTGVRL